MATVLITGAAGFIGSNLLRHALRLPFARIIVVDKLTYAGSMLNLTEPLTDPRVRFVQADIADALAMEKVFAETQPDAVLNLAAETHVDRSIDGPRAFLETNTVGTFTLLECARHHHARLSPPKREQFRFLHVSTDEVYGSLGPEGLFREETPYAPNSPYAASKASADHFVRACSRTYALPTLITNCSNNYGPRQFPEKLIPLMVLNALEGRPLPVYGDGGHVRDWLHVDDHCRGILLVLEKGRPGEKYNIGGGGERTNLDVVDAICDALEELKPAASNRALPAEIVSYRALRTFVTDRPGHDRRYAMDSSKIHQELGWEPRLSFEAGLRDTVRWYLENQDWCAAVQQGRYDRDRLGLGTS
jgi:dTDP-glucose 4,6-dehydratase